MCPPGLVSRGRGSVKSFVSYLADVMSFPNQRLHWDLQFYKEPQDWEMEQFDIFWNLIHSMTFTGEGHDKLC